MPAGPGPIGFVAFAGVKLVGYTIAALALERAFNSDSANARKVGWLARALEFSPGVVLAAPGFCCLRGLSCQADSGFANGVSSSS
jgi:hypothetical protein